MRISYLRRDGGTAGRQRGNGYPSEDGDVEQLAANNESRIKGKGLYPAIEESLNHFFQSQRVNHASPGPPGRSLP